MAIMLAFQALLAENVIVGGEERFMGREGGMVLLSARGDLVGQRDFCIDMLASAALSPSLYLDRRSYTIVG